MPDYDAWDLTNDFTVAQASCLWCEVDPGISFIYQKSRNPRIAAIEQMLVSEIKAGRLLADSTQNPLSSIGDYSGSLVSREALRELAERKGVLPKFLFPSARQSSSQAQASAPLAPRDGSASTRDKSPSFLGQSVGQEGEIDFVPTGCIGLPGAVHAVWRALHGDAMDEPIPFWREEIRDGQTVRVPTPEAAEEHKRRGRAQTEEAKELFLGGLAGGLLVAEVDDPNGTKRFTVPIWDWQSDRANMTISTGLLDLPTGSHSWFHLRTCFIRREAFHEWLQTIVSGVEIDAGRVATGDEKLSADSQGRGGVMDADRLNRRLANLYMEGRRILDELIEARTVEEAVRAVGREIAWRDAMLPVVEQELGPAAWARLYILHELEPRETERVVGASAFNRDHALSMVCHDARLYRLGKKLDGLDSAWRKSAGGPGRHGRKPGGGMIPDDPLIDEALRVVNTGEASLDWAGPDTHSSGFPGRPSKAKHLIEKEFQRRRDAGKVCSTLSAEAGALLEWLKREYPSAQPPTIKTIKNNLRDQYREYEQKQCSK